MTKPIFIITRPKHQTDFLCQEIKKAGGDYILFPTLEILPTPDLQPLNLVLAKQNTIDKIIFVSANAVHTVMSYWQKPLTTAVFAIGPGTANALRQYQIQAEIPLSEQYTSEGLLALPDMQSLTHQTVVIFSGENGRTLLAETLQQRGAKVQTIAVYQRIKPAENLSISLLNAWQAQTISAIIITSAESLKNLLAMAEESVKSWLCQQRLLVISPAMAVLAKQLGFLQPPIIADNASDEAILKALQFDNPE